MEIVIKTFDELSLDELYEIVKARFEVFACEQKITCENEFDDIDKKAIHIFSMNNGIVAGYLRVLPKGISYKDGVGIGRMIVMKDYRQQGIAKRLLRESIRYIKENFKDEDILLSAQVYVKDLYKSVGFKEISDVYEEAGITHVKMKYEEV